MSAPRIVVAIPARDEEALLPACLAAIRPPRGDAEALAVVVSCNNCEDATAARAHALAASLSYRLHVAEVALPPERAHAGGARRHAMDLAADWAAPAGVILTTDADGAPDADWVGAFDAAFATGVDAVAGRVSADWDVLSRFPERVLEVGAREWDYQSLCAELEARLDPEPHDPWPRHNQTCGANAGLTREWYRRIGGLPVLPTGEDGAMFREVWRRDGRVRHDIRPHVTVSARTEGRAAGGMAEALASRHGEDYLCDELLEPADALARRARWRRAARRAFAAGRLVEWAAAEGITAPSAAAVASRPHFGDAWLALEATVPQLSRRRLAPRDLEGEMARAEALLQEARRGQ